MVAQKIADFTDENLDRQIRILVDACRNPSWPTLKEYADNAGALAAGLKPGDVYRIGSDPKVVI
jgi:hypothetical protein